MGLRCIVQILTIIHLMKVTNGSPVTMMPKTGLLVTMTKGCEGEDKLLLAEDHSTTENILTYEWVYSTRNVFIGTTNIILCQKTSGGFEVNPSYYGKVEYCDTSGIQLKNISMNDSGYYKLQFLREIMEHKESQTIFLTVSATPTEQCKPVIMNHSGNVLYCTTHCEYLDLQWIWNKTESVVGNQSDLPISCSWKNEVILCCPKGQAMGCYKGSRYDLCTPTTPSSCIENTPGDDGSDIHAVKAPDKSDSNLMGLLTLVIIPVLLVILWIFCQNKIKSRIMMSHNRKNKSTQNCHINIQDESINLLDVKVEPVSTPTVEVKVELESTPNVKVKEEVESTPTVEAKEEPEFAPTIKVKEEPESTPTREVKEEPESTPTREVKEEPESTPTREVKEEPESTPTREVKEEPDFASTLEVKKESDCTPTQFLDEIVPMLKEKDEADSIPTQLYDPQHETEEKTMEHKTNADSETMRELQELRHAALCKVCFANEMNMVFMPCNHAVTCANCSSSLQQCPVCRAVIKRKIYIHFSEYNKFQ